MKPHFTNPTPHHLLVPLIAVIAALLGGCSGSEVTYESVTAAEIGASIERTVDLSDMTRGDANRLRKFYDIEATELANFVLYTASSNVRADELLIVKVNDPGEIANITERVHRRIAVQTSKFQNYRPEEYYLIEKHVLSSKGPFVFFAVSQDAERMERTFDETLR